MNALLVLRPETIGAPRMHRWKDRRRVDTQGGSGFPGYFEHCAACRTPDLRFADGLGSMQDFSYIENMRRRTRLAGITLLVAMSLSLAESAWASVCAGQMMDAADAEAASNMPHMPGMPDMPADGDCAGRHSHAEEGNAPHQQNCPFAPAALGNSCTGTASIPASTLVELPTLAIHVSTGSPPAAKPHSVSSAAPFHPPKA